MATKLPTATAAACVAAALLLPIGPRAMAQGIGPQNGAITSPVPLPAAVTLHAKITAIDPATRALTLTGASGQSVTITAGPAVRLELLKVGDRVNAQYYRSVAFSVAGPGTTAPPDGAAGALAQPVQGPGGVVFTLARISATVVGIDLADNSIDVIDPTGGAVRTLVVTDPSRIAMLPTLKVGDTVTATVSQALAVSITPAPKSWF